MTNKHQKMPKMVKDANNNEERDYILQDNPKTKFGATFIIVVLIILVLAVVASSMFISWE